MKNLFTSILFIFIALTASVVPVHAQVSSCFTNGTAPVDVGDSVGTTAASGQYVPVFDQAVAQNTNSTVVNTSLTVRNTGILVYKECVLRPLVDAQRKAATSLQVRDGHILFMTGRDGNPLFPQQYQQEKLLVASDPEILRIIDNGTYDTLSPTFQNSIKSAIGRGYYNATRRPNNIFTCPYKGDLQTILQGTPDESIQDALQAARNPACNPIFAAEMAYEDAAARVGAAQETFDKNLDWGQGVYPRTTLDDNGNVVVTTPASLVRAVEEQLLTSGYRQQEAATNVNEMVSTLFANVSRQIIGNNQGLRSLVLPQSGGGASYLDTVVSQAGGQATQGGTNAVLTLLNAALSLEQSYLQTLSSIATSMTRAIGQLRGIERQCWVSLKQNTCVTGTLSADEHSCTSVSGGALTRIATSTVFSQAVITSNVSPLASSTLARIATSTQTVATLNQIIAALISNPSAAGQAAALAQYNQLQSQGIFHTQGDITSIQTQQQSIAGALDSLIQNTIDIWAGVDTNGAPTIPWDSSISPGTGWCNYQNQPTIHIWIARWR